MSLRQEIERLFAPVWRRFLLSMAKAVVRQITHGDGNQYLGLELLADEEHPKTPVVQQFGLASAPMNGSEAVVLFLGGDRANGVVVATDDPRYRPMDLQPGEVAIYSSGDMLAEEEELPEPLLSPEEIARHWPEGWPPAPPEEVPEGEAWQPPLCRIRLLPDRTIEITGGAVAVRSLGDMSFAAEGKITMACKGEFNVASAEVIRLSAPLGRLQQPGDPEFDWWH